MEDQQAQEIKSTWSVEEVIKQISLYLRILKCSKMGNGIEGGLKIKGCLKVLCKADLFPKSIFG